MSMGKESAKCRINLLAWRRNAQLAAPDGAGIVIGTACRSVRTEGDSMYISVAGGFSRWFVENSTSFDAGIAGERVEGAGFACITDG